MHNYNKQSGVIVLTTMIVISLILITVMVISKRSVTNSKISSSEVHYIRVEQAAESAMLDAQNYIVALGSKPGYRGTPTDLATLQNLLYYYTFANNPGANTAITAVTPDAVWTTDGLKKQLNIANNVKFNLLTDPQFENVAVKELKDKDILTYTVIEDLTNQGSISPTINNGAPARKYYQITVRAVRVDDLGANGLPTCIVPLNNQPGSSFFFKNNAGIPCQGKESVMLQSVFSKL